MDRLGAKLYLFKKGRYPLVLLKLHLESDHQHADLEVLFHNTQRIEQAITTKLDPKAKGYVDLDDLKSLI